MMRYSVTSPLFVMLNLDKIPHADPVGPQGIPAEKIHEYPNLTHMGAIVRGEPVDDCLEAGRGWE